MGPRNASSTRKGKLSAQFPRAPWWVWLLSGLLLALAISVGMTFGPTLLAVAPILTQPQVSSRFETRYIPSESMVPTLASGDRLIIDKQAYQKQSVQRQDIVLFWPPEEAMLPGQEPIEYLFRVVGLPGETVQITRGQVLIQGQPLNEPYIQEAPGYEWGPEQVPSGHYFVLGDNRNNSYDSHYWGFVPQSSVVGKATKIFWPSARITEL
ncbi:MAG TPA: signal peptidase I [Leptolyngbyaceae cyanobacterium]